MQIEYKDFTGELRSELGKAEGFVNKKYRFPDREESLYDEDRLYIECGQVEEISQVCSFHLGSLYREYKKDGDIGIVSNKIIEELERMDHQEICDIALCLKEYESIRDRLFVRLVNYDENKASLEKAIYRRTGDIAQTLYVRMGVKDGVLTSAKIQNDLLKIWGKEEAEVFENALLNTCALTPPRVYKWEKLLVDSSYEGDDFMDVMRPGVLSKGPAGNCISTTGKTNGAAAAFFPGVLGRISELLEADLYLAFTSIHEVMVHSADSVSPDQLKEVLDSTIRDCTSQEEFLSKNIYYYSRAADRLFCIGAAKEEEDYGPSVVFA